MNLYTFGKLPTGLDLLNYAVGLTTRFWTAAATVVAAKMSSDAAKKAAAGQAAAARAAGEAGKFAPMNVQGLFGQGTFGDEGAQFQLTPEMQGLFGNFMNQARTFSTQGQTDIGRAAAEGGLGMLQAGVGSDPFGMAQTQFGRMEEILAPGRERQREALESRLLRQGRLGSTGGSLQQQGLEEAIEQSRRSGLVEALGQAQGIQQQQIGLGTQLGLFGQQQQDVGMNQALSRLQAAQGINQQGMELLRMGGAFGGAQTAANQFGANLGFQGAQAGIGAQLGSRLGIAQQLPQIASGLGGMFSSQPNNLSGMQGVNNMSEQDMMLAQQNQGF